MSSHTYRKFLEIQTSEVKILYNIRSENKASPKILQQD